MIYNIQTNNLSGDAALQFYESITTSEEYSNATQLNLTLNESCIVDVVGIAVLIRLYSHGIRVQIENTSPEIRSLFIPLGIDKFFFRKENKKNTGYIIFSRTWMKHLRMFLRLKPRRKRVYSRHLT